MLVFNSFSWFFPLFLFLNGTLNDLVEARVIDFGGLIIAYGLLYAAVAVSAIFGNFLSDKFGRNKLLLVWFIIGVMASVSMLMLSYQNVAFVYPVALIIGTSLGLGFPSCLAFFADHTSGGNRGLFGGFVFAVTFLGIFIIGAATTLLGFVPSILVLVFWRFTGFLGFLYLRPKETRVEESSTQPRTSYLNIVKQRTFLLYLVPWIMFCLINFFAGPFFDKFTDTDIIQFGEFGIGGVSALIAGYFSDIIGRKRLIIAAFVMVGIGYAVLSLSTTTPFVYAYALLDGIAWGIFMLMFFLVIWGEINEDRTRNRYYLFGNLPFILATYLAPIFSPLAGKSDLPVTAFTIASFFLFIAVIPLVYAPETLPEKTMKERALKSYVELAQKIKEKQT